MVKLIINGKETQTNEDSSVLRAAEDAGFQIPTMCFMEGFTNNPSCMVCLVKDKLSGALFPSCAVSVREGMEVITDDDEVKDARREALELLLSDHVGDCEAPCRNGCPAFMDIPLMNRLIAEGKFKEALVVVKEEIALPLILGYICEAPCEKVCRRRTIDQAVSICQLKKMVADSDLVGANKYIPNKQPSTGKRVAIVGAGPAGLSAAHYLILLGYSVRLYDKNDKMGGSLLSLPEDILPHDKRDLEIDSLAKLGVEFNASTPVDASLLDTLKQENDAVLLATGAIGDNPNKELGVLFDAKGFLVSKESGETNIPGVFACGSSIRIQKMAIRTVAQGKRAALIIDRYLKGQKQSLAPKMFNSRFGGLKDEEKPVYMLEAIPDDRVSPGNGHLEGYDPQEAILESKRCMRCDCRKTSSCKLRIYSDEYGADRKKYLGDDRKVISKHYNHDNIIYEAEKCIKCGICVELTASRKELTGLTYIGRGFDVKIEIPFDKGIQEALTDTASDCAKYCPTGAISFRPGEIDPDYKQILGIKE